MTVEEALEYFLTDREIHQMWNTAFDIATDALEKQIEKKAKRGGIYGPSCPSCYKAITEEYLGPYLMHCPFCGQALDWSRDE